MLHIGLTGGIGSGKTTVAEIFKTLGVPVYNADAEAKRIMSSDPSVRAQIISAFGEESYKGTVPNRSFLISEVFPNVGKLAMLNSIVHPVTIADASQWMARQKGPYAIKEAAILFESGAEKNLDYVIGVTAPESIRVQRIMERDGRTEKEIRQVMARQMDDAEKMSRCDFIIYNDGKHMLIPQVLEVHQRLTEAVP